MDLVSLVGDDNRLVWTLAHPAGSAERGGKRKPAGAQVLIAMDRQPDKSYARKICHCASSTDKRHTLVANAACASQQSRSR